MEVKRYHGPYKITLLGDSAVGKSSLVMRAVKNQFHEHMESTIGAAFLTKDQLIKDQSVKLELWDTAGQERFRALAPMYYRNAAAVIVCYDITLADSYEKARQWIKQVAKNGTNNPLIILVGTKVDLDRHRAVSGVEEDIQHWDEEIALYRETSSKTGQGIQELFEEIGKLLLEKKSAVIRPVIRLDHEEKSIKQKLKCPC